MSFCFIYGVVLENDSVQISPGGEGVYNQLTVYNRSKAVLLLWIFYVFFCLVFVMSFVRVRLFVPCGKLLGKG